MVREPSAPPDAERSHHLSSIQAQIEKIAEQAGVSPEDRQNLEAMLRALHGVGRRRVRLFLQGVKGQSNDPAVRQAADEFLSTAARVWGLWGQ
jgi:hypothetical protein